MSRSRSRSDKSSDLFPRVQKKPMEIQNHSRDLKIGMDPFCHAPNRLPLCRGTRNHILPVKNQILASDQPSNLSFPREIKLNDIKKMIFGNRCYLHVSWATTNDFSIKMHSQLEFGFSLGIYLIISLDSSILRLI